MVQFFRSMWSKRLVIVGWSTVLWTVLLFLRPDTALELKELQYGLWAWYMGWQTWGQSRPGGEECV